MSDKKKNSTLRPIGSSKSLHGLKYFEAKYREGTQLEALPVANKTSYVEIARDIIKDRKIKEITENGGIITDEDMLLNPIYITVTEHLTTLTLHMLLVKVREYMQIYEREGSIDILSISGGIMENNRMRVVTLFRYYGSTVPEFENFYEYLGEKTDYDDDDEESLIKTGLNTEKLKKIKYTEKEIAAHEHAIRKQQAAYNSNSSVPFLNQLEKYEQASLPDYDESRPLLYLLNEKEKRTLTVASYSKFMAIFREAMQYMVNVDLDTYYAVLKGHDKEENFMNMVQTYIERTFVNNRKTLDAEDVPRLMAKMYKALFQLYIVQDLIDDPEITDIKITDPYTIRVRIKGKAYLSDITFIDEDDYIRFINALIIRNGIDTSVPEQTFTDEHDANYILRFTITMPYISSNNLPVLHIRKISRKKMMAKDLIQAGMFDEKIKNYLLDCGKNATGIVFAGPPGSGKTIALNWFMEEAYEDSAEILVIQENDELFAYRKGIIFQHIVLNPVDGQKACTLEDLGQLALVAGANVFVIGEAKGAEICSAVTLSNSGCRTAMTIHSRSSTDAIDKMADLAMRGYATNFEQAKRMMKNFQIIVFLRDFKVVEISEVVGFDEQTKDMIYKPIYRKDN